MSRVVRGWVVSVGLAAGLVVALLVLALARARGGTGRDGRGSRFRARRRSDRPRDVPRLPPGRRHRAVRVPDGARPRDRAALVVAALEGRRMPPWPPSAASPQYVGEAAHTLDARERTTLVDWARAGSSGREPHGVARRSGRRPRRLRRHVVASRCSSCRCRRPTALPRRRARPTITAASSSTRS